MNRILEPCSLKSKFVVSKYLKLLRLKKISSRIAHTKYEIANLCNTPIILKWVKYLLSSLLVTNPKKNNKQDRLVILYKTFLMLTPPVLAALLAIDLNESGSEIPIMNTKHGNTVSARCKPFQTAWSY